MFTSACAADTEEAKVTPATEEDKVFYFLGTAIYENLAMLELSDAEAEQVVAGLRDSLAGEAQELDETVYGPKLRAVTEARIQAADQRRMAEEQAYADEMAATDGAVKTDSGLVYIETVAGAGAQPDATSTVVAHYTGTLVDGRVFDSSVDRGQPLEIGLNQVIPCWTEGMAMMKVGGKAKLVCPPDIAYGPRGQGMIPPNAILTFEVELLEVK
jgi:FKBP-type peptidyl-prolyl cis-trans isomerase